LIVRTFLRFFRAAKIAVSGGGLHARSPSRADFSAAYYRLARRYHPDVNPATHELMANINAARTVILQSYRRPS